MRKMISLPESYARYLKKVSKDLDIAESDFIRRLLDKYKEEHEKEKQSR